MAKKKVRKPPIYKVDGRLFKTKPMMDFYKQLKELKEQGFIKSFELPTIEEQKAKSKYGAKKCEVDGNIFDSLMEAKFYIFLRHEKEYGDVVDFELQPKFKLQESFKKNGKTIRAIHYIADFLVEYKDGTKIVYDVKGRETADFKLKKKLFDYKYRNLTLICVQYRERLKRWIDIHNETRVIETAKRVNSV